MKDLKLLRKKILKIKPTKLQKRVPKVEKNNNTIKNAKINMISDTNITD